MLLEKYLDKKIAKDLTDAIKARIKPPEVTLSGDLVLTSYAPNGVTIIKDALKQAEAMKDVPKIRYKGAGTYYVQVKAGDYKTGERILKELVDKITAFAGKNKLTVAFKRVEK